MSKSLTTQKKAIIRPFRRLEAGEVRKRRFWWERHILHDGRVVVWKLGLHANGLTYQISTSASLLEIEMSSRKVPAMRLRDARNELRRIEEE